MDKEVLEEGKKNEEGRLKIKEIKKLKNKNRILSLLRIAGISTCFYIDFTCVLSIMGQIGASYPLLNILIALFATRITRRVFVLNIEGDMQANNDDIIKLQNEILDNKEKLTEVK